MGGSDRKSKIMRRALDTTLAGRAGWVRGMRSDARAGDNGMRGIEGDARQLRGPITLCRLLLPDARAGQWPIDRPQPDRVACIGI